MNGSAGRNVIQYIIKPVLGPQIEGSSYVENACDSASLILTNRTATQLSGIAPLFVIFISIATLGLTFNCYCTLKLSHFLSTG
jgi:hypothetical protein